MMSPGQSPDPIARAPYEECPLGKDENERTFVQYLVEWQRQPKAYLLGLNARTCLFREDSARSRSKWEIIIN